MKSKQGIWILVLAIIGVIIISGCAQQPGAKPSEKTQPSASVSPSTQSTEKPVSSSSPMPPPKQSTIPTSPYSVAFTVKVPENTPNNTIVYLQISEVLNEWGRNLKMEKTVENVWDLKADLRDFKDKEIGYRYLRNNWGFVGAEEFSPDSKTASRRVLVEKEPKQINDTVEKWRWMPKGDVYQMPIIPTNAGKVQFLSRVNSEKFQEGALIVDFWWGNFKDLLDSTHVRMKEKGFQWIEIAPPWDYKQVNPVPIITSEGFGHTYSDEEINFHLKKMKADGFKVYMAPQICCADTSKASFSKEWWNEWFSEYEKYAMYFVDKANKYNVEYLIITGDWVAVAASPDKRPADYKERLEAIYSKVKSAYSGKLGRNLFIGGEIDSDIPNIWPNPDDIPFMKQADFIGINWWVGLTDKNNPTQEELNTNAKRIFDLRLKPLYEKYKKPVILQQVAYPSIDGGLTGKAGVDDAATALWEIYSDKYKLDLEEQAMGFEAIMNVVSQSFYIIGVYPFTYWPDEFPLTKEYNIRGKPAEDVLSQWYKSLS
ncbi:MAG: hypothetical protein HY512_00905 [Candidatus Aenigmarchaeota archaeon]|nr:hypothetical protein [Candidatus Aenigmarchaeota archaeon]